MWVRQTRTVTTGDANGVASPYGDKIKEDKIMACFLVTVAEAAVVSAVNAAQKKKGTTEKSKNPFVKKLNWLPKFL